jgi:hypothetical protein
MANVPPAIRSPRPNNIQYVPGDLYWNPTDLTDPDKYGTWLGTTAAPPELRTNGGSVPITDETFMNEVDDKLDRSMAPTLFALLAEHTSTLYELGFSPHYTTGKAYKVISRASTGLFRSDILAGKLLFLPYDRDNHNCILMYRALPELDSAARLARALGEAHVIPIVFSAVQDPVKNLLAEDLLANITLLPLIITNVSHGTPGVTTATITWDTNRDATSKVKYHCRLTMRPSLLTTV